MRKRTKQAVAGPGVAVKRVVGLLAETVKAELAEKRTFACKNPDSESAKTLAEAESYGHVYGDGRIHLAATGKLVTLSEMRKMKAASNRAVRYADANDGGSDEPWETPQ